MPPDLEPSRHPSSEDGSAPTRGRAPHLGPARRRPEILDAAMRLFMERGYRGTSMEAIADAVGVSKPVIYDCFPGKAELLGALLDREEQRMFERFGAAMLSAAEPGDIEGALVAGFTSMLTVVEDEPQAYRAVLLDGADDAAGMAARVKRGRERQLEAIAAVARDWMRGLVPEERLDAQAQFVAQTLLSIGEAGTRMILTEPQRWSPRELGRALGRLAAAGYTAAFR